MRKFVFLILSALILTLAGSAFESVVHHSAYAQKKKRKSKPKVEKEEVKEPEADAEEGDDETDGEETPEDVKETASATLQRGNRMEFDGRLIRGETAGSGAVFLFQRVPRPLPSMVKTRTSYLSDTVQEVLGDGGTEQFEKTKVEAMKEIEKEGQAKILKLQTESAK